MLNGLQYYLCSLAVAGSLATARKFDVKVGESGLTFTPDTIHASVGDEVAFTFTKDSHDVTLGKFDNPCQPGDNAFWSGTINVPPGGQANATFTITIRDTDPKWIYCSYGRHCQRGMVGVINPPSGGNQNLAAFKNAAQSAGASNHPSSINGGSLIINGPIEVPGFPPGGSSSSQAPSGTSSHTGSQTASATGTATGTATASSSFPEGPTKHLQPVELEPDLELHPPLLLRHATLLHQFLVKEVEL
ncbi:hypothetical protein PRK78_003169 [Emydomyces testavorans]|uniref:Extracellular serine-rich protein n=1 Tax=Emydomyces testavorans TaxID=2070801 RepID=A0AAF0II93_9EURO|nr:hypothetical protein PRK78_003169 [Emydomyces testavorans]